MEFVREVSAKGLALRAAAGIKVRQPLSKFKIPRLRQGFGRQAKSKIIDKLLSLVKEEINVKEIIFGDKFELDTKITKKLGEEGTIRELTRQIQEMRKDGKLVSKNSIKLYFKIDNAGLKNIVEIWQKNLSDDVGAETIEFVANVKDGLLVDRHFKIENKDVWIGVSKIH